MYLGRAIWEIYKSPPPGPELVDFLGPNGLSPPPRITGKVVGASPPTCSAGFWGVEEPCGPPKIDDFRVTSKFIGFGDIHGPRPYKFSGFGDSHGPKPYKFIGFGDSPAPKLAGY